MRYEEFLLATLPAVDAEVTTYGQINHEGRSYELKVLQTEGARQLFIFTGFHGDEPAGPFSMLRFLPEVVEYAKQRGVGLRVYPCINPEGFSEGHRYGGEAKQNNYVFQYRLPDGNVTAELPEGSSWTELVSRATAMPQETQALVLDLAQQPRPFGILDLHQDGDINGRSFYVYAYDKELYLPIMAACREVARPAAGVPVSPGGDTTPRQTDRDGFVLNWHDGSLTDWFWHQKVPCIATLETAAKMPLEAAMEVNRIWMRGMIDLVSSW